jgi:pyruvate/2-oxoglutarate dehydrogenase complex dihydrolipoamide acyltransferase (E2) component
LLLALLGTATASADVYRSVDAHGNVAYSDRPTEKSEPVYVNASKPGRPGNPVTAPKTAADNAQANAQNGQNAQASSSSNQPGAQKEKGDLTPAEKEAEKAKNCQLARERKVKYDQSHRLFKTGPNGDREYLSDSEIDQARAQATADVQTWCGG